jgi:hypothetical protein
MEVKVLEMATELTKEAIAHNPIQLGGGPLNSPDVAVQFLDKVARKLDELFNEPAKRSR